MTSSILLTTYNGAEYINELLESLLNQTRSFDELIVVDDCSTDNTFQLLSNILSSRSNVRIIRNEINKGWRKNFLESLEYTSNEVIMFCDQDDIWCHDKIEKVMSAFEKYPNIRVMNSKFVQIDESGNQTLNINMRHMESKGTKLITKLTFRKNFQWMNVPGCVLSVHKSLTKYIKYNIYEVPHDSFFYKTGILLECGYELDSPLIKYRIHSSNSSGATNVNLHGKQEKYLRAKDIEENNKVIDVFLKICRDEELCSRKIKVLTKSKIVNQRRIKLLSNRFLYLALLAINIKYYSNIRVFFGDISYAFRMNKVFGRLYFLIKKKRK